MPQTKNIVDEQKIFEHLEKTRKSTSRQILEILKKALKKKGLNLKEVGYLVNTTNSELIEKMFDVAHKIKWEIYGERLVFFLSDSGYFSFN
jgi:2-iminoacetate synthase